MESPEQTVDKQSGFDRFLRYFLSLGTFGFGGPIATVGYMQRDLVEKRGWLAKQQFLNGIALGQTMPGSLAAQVAMWVGYLRRGALGALAVSLAFILPSFLLVLTVSFFYVRYQGLSWMQSLFYGIAPAVMAIIALAAVKLARLTDGTDTRLWAISLVVMAVSAITAKAGAFIFGSGLAIVPFLREGVVNQHPWLTQGQFLDAVAVGRITPGPVVITATFIGYLVGGLTRALIATVAIFAPIYLGVMVPGGWFIRHQENPQIQAFVKGATAAAAGAIAGATVVLTRQAIVDMKTAVIALAALILLWHFKMKEPFLVLLASATGLVLH